MTRDELTAYLASLDDVTHERVADLIACYRAMPAGLDAVVRVFQHGARKHNDGRLGIAPWVTPVDCADHLIDHADDAFDPESGTFGRDHETGELHAAHAAARGIMAAQLVESVERGEVW